MNGSSQGIVALAAVAYLLVVTAVGAWATRRTRTSRDFFIAGGRIGLLTTALATMSAAFSGFVFIGGPGLTYRMGIGAAFLFLPVGFTAGLLCWAVAQPLHSLAARGGVYTVPDALAVRYRSRLTSGLGAVAVIGGAVGYLGAQVLAMGVLIEVVFGTRAVLGPWSLPAAMAVGLAFLLAYSVGGGMLAGVYTDLVQGGMMLAAAAAIAVQAIRVTGGPVAVVRSIAGSKEFGASFLQPFGTVPAMTALGFFLVFGVGILGQPHVLHKFYMINDPGKLRWFPAILGGSQSLCLLVWLAIGLAVPAMVARGSMPAPLRPDDVAPAFVLGFTPGPLAALVLAAVLAAAMSTADSLVNVGSAALVRDLPRALGIRVRNELRWGRLASLALGVAAALFAYLYGNLVALLGMLAFGLFGASLAPALAVGLRWKRVPAWAASASIATGLLATAVLEVPAARALFSPGVLPPAVALAASFTVLVTGSWWGKRNAAADDRIARAA